jgi:hypothetical protein
MVKEYCKNYFGQALILMVKLASGGNLDEGTRFSPTWESFEKLFSNKWIKDTNKEEMFKIQEELREAKEEIKKKGDELWKI